MMENDMASDGLSSFGSSQQAVSPVPASIPDATKLTANQQEALRGLLGTDEGEMFRTFKGIAANCDLDPQLIRRTVRSLARKGLATYAKGLWTDDGEPAGAGYALTNTGQKLADELRLEAHYVC
jgi:hypothetical protein